MNDADMTDLVLSTLRRMRVESIKAAADYLENSYYTLDKLGESLKTAKFNPPIEEPMAPKFNFHEAGLDMTELMHDAVREDRAASTVTVVPTKDGSGSTTWHNHKVAAIAAPMGEGAYSRTVRMHELLHANKGHNPNRAADAKFNQLAVNAVDDIIVHAKLWDHKAYPEQANRDCLAVGYYEARGIQTKEGAEEILTRYRGTQNEELAKNFINQQFNRGLHAATRAMAIASCNSEAGQKVDKIINSRFAPAIARALRKAVRLATAGKRERAIRTIQSILRETENDKSTEAMRIMGVEGPGGDIMPPTGQRIKDPMAIRTLELTHPATASPAPRIKLGRSGARLHRPAIARMIANKSTVGAFQRPRYVVGGAWLFDASGSMDINTKLLSKLCRLAPASTVAFYYGYDSEDRPSHNGQYGELVIYAKNGRRANKIAKKGGNNNVDLFALQWLLKQPGPRYIITDGGFCGGPHGQAEAAMIMLDNARRAGKVTQITSTKRALEHLAGQATA